MSGVDLMREAIGDLGKVFLEDIKPLSDEQLAWQPAQGCNSIGFTTWHMFRILDDYLQDIKGEPSLWQSEQWHVRFDLPPKFNGLGADRMEAPRLPGGSKAGIEAYATRIIANTADFLAALDEAKLDAAPDPAKPRRTVGRILLNFIVAHAWWHIGEVRYLKGMQGMPAAR